MPKISALPAGSTPLAGTELVPVVQGGQTVHVPASSLGGGSTPTGTGFRHITAGAEDAAAAKVDPTNAAHMTVGGANTVLTSNGTVGAWASIVNANVDAAAAIAGTKISPDFGAQNVVTTGFIAIGASPATAGDLRLTSTGKILAGTNLTAFEASGTSAYVCTSAAFGGQFNIANLYAASAVALGLASSTYQYLTGGNNEAWKPRTGSATGATPYASEKAASQAMADADQTAAAAVYMAATIVATGALTALRRITLPDATDAGGYRKTINNTTTGGFGLVIAVSTGTTVTIAASKTADVWIDSRGVTRLTPDT